MGSLLLRNKTALDAVRGLIPKKEKSTSFAEMVIANIFWVAKRFITNGIAETSEFYADIIHLLLESNRETSFGL